MHRSARWRRENPLAARATDAVRKALREGRLVRPDRCQRCGTRTRVTAVHADLRRPLEVAWICYHCRYADRQAAAGRPRPYLRREGAHVPEPRAIRYQIACGGRTSDDRSCPFAGRYRGIDGDFYCGHHLPRV